MSLEKQLADLAEIHGLNGITVSFMKLPSGHIGYGVYVHRNEKCAVDKLYGGSIAGAFKDALMRLNADIADVEFEAFGSKAG